MSMRAFKSVAERTRLERLVKSGGFQAADFAAMQAASDGLALPDRLTPKRELPRMSTPKLSKGRSTRYDGLALGPPDPHTQY